MIKLLIIGCGGFFGALMRYGAALWILPYSRGDFPLGTLMVNIAGSFVLGWISGFSQHQAIDPHLKDFLTIGLLGAFTTFSTFSFEALQLLEGQMYGKAFVYLSMSIAVGLFAVLTGMMSGRAMA